MKRLLSLIIIIISIFLWLSSCRSAEPKEEALSLPESAETENIDYDKTPLKIESVRTTTSGVSAKLCEVRYSGMDSTINKYISDATMSLAEAYSDVIKGIDYDVKYNNHGILSLLLKAEGKDGEASQYYPICLNTVTGKEISMSELFKSSDDEWRGLLKFYTEQMIRIKKIDTHSDISFNKDKLFYLTQNKIGIVYEMYEISYCDEGSMCFEVPFSVLKKCIDKDSCIAIISDYEDGM